MGSQLSDLQGVCRKDCRAADVSDSESPAKAYAYEDLRHSKILDVDRWARRYGQAAVTSRCRQCRSLADEYALGASVGKNTNGAVRRATKRTDGKTYAVKSFRKASLDKTATQRLRNEIEIYLSVDHPHIARLHEVLETASEIHIVMEFLSGGELLDYMRHGTGRPEGEVVGVVQQAVRIVAYLHSQNIAHRDLKLENLLFEAEGSSHLKLIDFGLSKRTGPSPAEVHGRGGSTPRAGGWSRQSSGASSRQSSKENVGRRTSMRRACGSADYVAPEVFTGAYTEKIDLWSLGVITHLLLVGVPIVGGKDSEEIVSKIRAGDICVSPKLCLKSSQAQDFVRQLLMQDPDRRLSAEAALRHPWLLQAQAPQARQLDPSILRGVQGLSQATPLRRAVLSVMARCVTTEDRGAIREQFFGLAEPARGTIPLVRLQTLLAQQVGAQELHEITKSLQLAGQDELVYSDFLAAALESQDLQVKQDLVRRAFAKFDRSGSGRVSEQDLVAFGGIAGTLSRPRSASPRRRGARLVSKEPEPEDDDEDSSEDAGMNFDDFSAFCAEELGLGGGSSRTSSPVRRRSLFCGA